MGDLHPATKEAERIVRKHVKALTESALLARHAGAEASRDA
jgi:hypothetical protein